MPNLMWLFVIPLISSLIIFSASFLSRKVLYCLAVSLSFLPLIFLVGNQSEWIGSEVVYDWLPNLSIQFYLNVDALSLAFLYLVALIIPISLFAIKDNDERLVLPHVFYGLILFLQGLLIGFFTARDLALFTIFWEAILIPIYFMIAFWGGEKRQYAALKFLIYMIAGSALMVAAVLSLYMATSQIGISTFNMNTLMKISEQAPYAGALFAVFMLAFSVKTPLFPFHAWLADAYQQAPNAGTILLSALLSKAGIYGFLRIGMELFPSLIKEWGPFLMGFAIAGVLYGGLAAWQQTDFKRLIAYSSFSHVNFILAGLFVWDQIAHTGAILQALNHGITIAALFLVAGWLADRLGSTAIGPYSGMAKFLPKLCWLTLIFVLSSVALPATNNFVGEFLILLGVFNHHPWGAAALTLTVILSAIYMLRWMQKVYFEESRPFQDTWVDIQGKELLIALPLVLLIFGIGIYPQPLLNLLKPAVEKIDGAIQLEQPQ